MKRMMPLSKTQLSHGFILPVALVALLVIMIASVGLIRSTDTSLQVSGKLAFKQDAVNQAERATEKVKALFETGALTNVVDREQDQLAQNYYASIQVRQANGLPDILLDTSAFDGLFSANNIVDSSSQITVRYVIERLCFAAGEVTLTNCITSTLNSDIGGDAQSLGNQGKVLGIETPVYRISVRVTGPLNTNAFMQSEFSY